jgi:hypothetical protein
MTGQRRVEHARDMMREHYGRDDVSCLGDFREAPAYYAKNCARY